MKRVFHRQHRPYQLPASVFVVLVALFGSLQPIQKTPAARALSVEQQPVADSAWQQWTEWFFGGASPGTDPRQPSTLHMLAGKGFGGADEVVRQLASGVSVEGQNDAGQTALWLAAQSGNLAVGETLLQAGANIEAISPVEGDTPLIAAAWNRKPEFVELLLRWNASMLARNAIGATALHEAAEATSARTVSVLLDSGADIDDHSKDDGLTPLHIAVWKESRPVLEVLLQHGANVHSFDDHGQAPVHHAIVSTTNMQTTHVPILQ